MPRELQELGVAEERELEDTIGREKELVDGRLICENVAVRVPRPRGRAADDGLED